MNIVSRKCKEKFSLNYIRSFSSRPIIGLTNDQNHLREIVKKTVDIELAPFAKSIDSQNHFPRFKEFWRILGSNGLHGITVPEKYGGVGLGFLEHILVVQEISRASGSIGLSYAAHSNLCVNQIERNGTEIQKFKYLPKLLSGEHIGSLAMSEGSAGSDVLNMKLMAEKNNNGDYVLNGSKFWITNATVADLMLVYAKTDKNQADKKHAITCFIVEKGFKGLSIGKELDKVGMRGSPTSEVIFENCVVPKENILGQLNKGVYVLMSGLDYERLVLSGGPIGLMQAAIDVAFPYCHTRETFGKKIAEHQIMQAKLADMLVYLESSMAHLYWIANSTNNNKADSVACAGVFLKVSENAIKVALEAIQCLGGNGYTNDYPLGRILRDAKLYDIGGGTSEIRRWLIGRSINSQYKH